jgi:molybdenum cofactor cytidylyltransferase
VKQDTTAIVVALGDEPFVDGTVSRALISMWRESGRPIVVARYAGEIGHPILFHTSVFPELMALDGDRGARGVIQRSPDRVAYVDMTTAPPLDVDEPNDLRRLADGIWYPRRENAP